MVWLVPCVSGRGRVVYAQDFGCNDSTDAVISTDSLRECRYRQLMTEASYSGSCAVRKVAFRNGRARGGSQWYRQDDHTYEGDVERGCFLQVDCGLVNELFYEFDVRGVGVGERIEVSLWVVNLYTGYQKAEFERCNWRMSDPELDLILFDEGGKELVRFGIGPVVADERLGGRDDYRYSARWSRYVFEYVVRRRTGVIRVAIGNRTTVSPGNDLGLDDIVVRVY